MNKIVREYFDRVEISTTESDLRYAINAAAASLGFHSFAFLTSVAGRNQPLLISTYPKAWTDHYMACGYQVRDPVILQASRIESSFVWSAEMAREFGSDARAFFSEAEKFHICCGLTIPFPKLIGGSSAMSFATDIAVERLEAARREFGPLLFFLAYHFRSELRRSIEPVTIMDGVELTPRERECLEWATRGKSRTDSARIMCISRRMVVRDLESVKAKLGVRSIAQAIAIYVAWKATFRH